MYFDTSVYWSKGAVREANQDSLIVQQALTSRGRVLLAAVCDGMGGEDEGERASGYLTEELIAWFYDSLLRAISKKKPLWSIRHSAERKIYQVQSRIQRYAKRNSLQMGTTLSLLLLWEKKYLLWHLGDSRIYHLHGRKTGRRKERMELLTKDHVCGSNMLTKCVGSFGFFMPDFKMGAIRSGEGFLLCSDGFWHKIKPGEIEDVLPPEQMTKERCDKRLHELGVAIMRREETDNLSAIYIITRNRKESGYRHGESSSWKV